MKFKLLILALSLVALGLLAASPEFQTATRFRAIFVRGDLEVDGTSNLDVVDIDGAVDFGGQELDLDADNDTSITADTDDQIDIEIAGADDFTFSANSFAAASGSVIDVNGTADGLVLDADGDTTLAGNTDDQIDVEVGGADKLRITAMGPALVEGSVIALGAAGTITPTNPYQPITSTAAVTASATTAIADGTVVGQLVCLVNENASDAINIPDAANTNLSGQAALGNDDVLCVLWDGADWLEISQVDN